VSTAFRCHSCPDHRPDALCIIASWKSVTVRVARIHDGVLLLETLMVGTFSALDLMLFYLFFEAA